MFRVENDKVWLTRGDSAEFRPIIQDYETQEGDKIIFALKRSYSDEAPVLTIETDLGKNIVFTPETTKDLRCGSYLYDLKIITVDGSVSTFVNAERFTLLEDIANAPRD